MISRLFTANSVQEAILMTPHSTGTNDGSIRNDFTNCLFTQSLIHQSWVVCLVAISNLPAYLWTEELGWRVFRSIQSRHLNKTSNAVLGTGFSQQTRTINMNIVESKVPAGEAISLLFDSWHEALLTLFRNHDRPSCRRYQNDEHIHRFVAYFSSQIPRGWFDPNRQWPWDVWPHLHHGKQQRLVYPAWL